MALNLATIKLFFNRSDVRIIIFGTATGAILQILSKRYLKNHPEFLKNLPDTKETIPRGGAGAEIGAVKTILQAILAFLAEHGLTAGAISGAGIVVSRIPVTAISTFLQDACQQNLSDLDKKKFVILEGEKLYLDQCDENLMRYLSEILPDFSFGILTFVSYIC